MGAFDLAGNVWEWVQDWYGLYLVSDQTNPIGPTSGTLRVLRGGAWYDIGAEVRAVRRNTGFPDFGYDGFGFRCMAKGLGRE